MTGRISRSEWLFLILLSGLVGWEAILAGYKLSRFPYEAIDFFQHYFLAVFVNAGGAVEDPAWPGEVGAMLGLQLPLDLEQTATLLPYQILVLPLFRWLAHLPMSVACGLWLVGCGLLIGVVGYCVARAMGVNPTPALFALGLWPAVWHVLLLGNIDPLAWALTNLGWIALFRGRLSLEGFWIGWAAMLKGFPIFAAFPWLIRRPVRILLGLLVGIAAAFLWGIWAGGWSGWMFFLQHLPDYGREVGRIFTQANNSLLGLLQALFAPPFHTMQGVLYRGLLYPHLPVPVRPLYALGAMVALAIGWVWSCRRPGPPSWAESGAWLSLGLLLWPISWINYHIYLFALLLALVHRRRDLRPSTRCWLFALLVLMTLALSYWALNAAAAPWMAVSFLLGLTRLGLWGLFVCAEGDLVRTCSKTQDSSALPAFLVGGVPTREVSPSEHPGHLRRAGEEM